MSGRVARDLAGDLPAGVSRGGERRARAHSVMCAYNRVDGVPRCASADLLQSACATQWGFDGYVVSDCGAIADIYREPPVPADAGAASAAAVKAGTDLTCGTEYASLVDAVRTGLITEAEIDRSLVRLFVARFRLGMFDPPERVPYARIPDLRERLGRASRARARGRARVDRAPQERSAACCRCSLDSAPSRSSARRPTIRWRCSATTTAFRRTGHAARGHREAVPGREVRYALGATYTASTRALLPAASLTPRTRRARSAGRVLRQCRSAG